MLPLTSFHAPRGDGLRQEFLEFFASHQALGAANIEGIAAHLAEHFSQAGPNPVGEVGGVSSERVLPFRKPSLAAPSNSKRTV
jgi:hypothetical protein